MKQQTIAVIGAGRLGSALIHGLISAGHEPTRIWATRSKTTSPNLSERFGIHFTHDNKVAASHADVLILAVEPMVMSTVLTELADIIQERKPLLISVAAGVPEAFLRDTLGGGKPHIVLAMPNTPTFIRSGTTALFANDFATAAEKQLAQEIFDALGSTIWVDHEAHIHCVTAISGSGPAYFFLLMEALQEAAEKLGLPADIAQALVSQTAIGSARMLQENGYSAADLRRRVTSPGGGTEKSMLILETASIHEIIIEAVQAGELHFRTVADSLKPKAKK